MKKLFSLILTLALLCSAALAEVCTIDTTGLTLDIGNLEVFELSAKERADGAVLWFGDSKTLDCAVTLIDADGVTLDELADYMLDDSDGEVVSSGMVRINGLDAFSMELADGSDDYIMYYLLIDDTAVEIACYYDGKAAAKQFRNIINTLSPARSGSSAVVSGFSGRSSVIPGTSLKLDVSALEMLDIDQDDLDDDMVLQMTSDGESLYFAVWVYSADGYTLADVVEELAEDENCISSGYTTINGIETCFSVVQGEVGTLVEYCTIDGKNIVEIAFLCEDDAAAQLSGQIMNTLTR